MIGTPLDPAAAQVLGCYGDAPRGDRFHVRFRWRSCPLPVVAREVPLRGRVLEIGCGHGLLSLYLAVQGRSREVLGVDIDPDKIALARHAAARLTERDTLSPQQVQGHDVTVRFETVEPDRFAEGSFDSIVIADVLYLLRAQERSTLLDACVDHLAPEGVIVVKEADRVPRWKGAITVSQELLATKVLHITEGDEVEFAPPSKFVDQLCGRGLRVSSRRVDRGYLHPHVLMTARSTG